MFRFLVSCLFVCLASLILLTNQSDLPPANRPRLIYVELKVSPIYKQIEQSIGRLTILRVDSGAVCTAFSIADRKYLTAAHCTDGILKVDKKQATLIKVDLPNDLAVLLVDLVKPAVQFREDVPEKYESAHAIGYGMGFTQPIITIHKVMLSNYVVDDGVAPGTVYMGSFVGGQSGGPVFDDDGKVIGIIQRASEQIGYGVSTATIKEFLESPDDLESHPLPIQ